VLQCPEYVAVSPVNGDIVVTDFERHTVVLFDKFGRLLSRYSGVGNNAAVATRSGMTDRNRLLYKRILEVRMRQEMYSGDLNLQDWKMKGEVCNQYKWHHIPVLN